TLKALHRDVELRLQQPTGCASGIQLLLGQQVAVEARPLQQFWLLVVVRDERNASLTRFTGLLLKPHGLEARPTSRFSAHVAVGPSSRATLSGSRLAQRPVRAAASWTATVRGWSRLSTRKRWRTS